MPSIIIPVECSYSELTKKLDDHLDSARGEYHPFGSGTDMVGKRDGVRLMIIRRNAKPIRNVMATVFSAQISSEGACCVIKGKYVKSFFTYAFAAIWFLVWMMFAVVFLAMNQAVLNVLGLAFAAISLGMPAACLIHRKKIRDEYLDFIRDMLDRN